MKNLIYSLLTRILHEQAPQKSLLCGQVRRFRTLAHAICGLIIVFLATPGIGEPVKTPHVEAELISENMSVQPGAPFWVALRLKMIPHWHTYWRNAGDAGLPTKIDWDLPEGYSAGDIEWPYPERIIVDPLVNYGYEGEVLHLVQITPPDKGAGTNVTLKANASWLVCEEICIPERANLKLTLNVRAEPPESNSEWADAFESARRKLPLHGSGWSIQGTITDNSVVLTATPPDWLTHEISEAHFYPYESGLIDYAAEQYWEPTADGYSLTLRRLGTGEETPDKVTGILVSGDGWRGPESEHAIEIGAEQEIAPTPTGAAESRFSVLYYLLTAFVGGLFLNLMPCVFPILSIKVMGLVKQAQEAHTQPWKHGLVFVAGVLVSFWALAGILLALIASGSHIGWGFQLQSPVVVLTLIGLFFLLGLSMFGMFEIGTSLTGAGSELSSKQGYAGSFFSGLLATVVATPCTAPFMGAALGFALTQSAIISLLVFTALALGMALPFFLLTCNPALLKKIPRPGPWMETLKKFMGLLLFATVAWLSWVLAAQTGGSSVKILAGFLIALGAAGFVFGKWGAIHREDRTRRIATVASLAIIGGASVGAMNALPEAGTQSREVHQGSISWEPFSPELVEQYRGQGETVLIDFTAAWCLTCQVNERVAFSSSEVQNKLKELNVKALKADWTSRDETITKALAAFGRSGVPFYVIYPGKSEPVTLPEILTPGIVLNALAGINPNP